jgi:hypothetical protein
MRKNAVFRIFLPVLTAMIVMSILTIHSFVTNSSVPHVKNGVLDLSAWDAEKDGAFSLSGEWEFYWGELLSASDIKSSGEKPILVEAPTEWTDYSMGEGSLPGKGMATYHARIINVPEGARLGVRIQNMASAYRLYIDNKLIASNGNFGDEANAAVSGYHPQLAEFNSENSNLDLVLQVSNNAYAVGGMWEPVVFGGYNSVAGIHNLVKFIGYFSLGSVIVMCIFFFIIYIATRAERETLVLSGVGIAVFVRLLISGDMTITYLLPGMPIAGFGWIDYLTLIWIQYFLLKFAYSAYTSLVSKWQVQALLIYSIFVSLFVVAFPFDLVTSTYMIMNILLLLILITVVVHLARAAYGGKTGASSLLGVMSLVLFSIFYEMVVNDLSVAYFILMSGAIEFTLLFFVQCFIIARRYNEARKMEMRLLKSQIHPHFIHNALATIISVSRKDPDRSRELLMDFSSYLRGCYDYENNDDLISLEQELEFVRAYVAIEQARFGDKLKVEYEIKASNNILLPPLVLQPLVENAFIHGLRQKEEGGTVLVYAVRGKDDTVRIGVRDDGVGMGNKAKEATKRRGIGIENINRRLSRLYHTQLNYLVPEGGGCEVYMEIPFKEELHDESTAH